MTVAEWRVPVGADETTALYESTTGERLGMFVCAHGAGGHMRDRAMQRVADTMRSIGLDVVRFNFIYREKGSGRPDPMPRLEECVAAVMDRARAEIGPQRLLIGGRSMGGRAASMIAAAGVACDGLVLLAYPLHPAGLTERLRDAHLSSIRQPALCINGTRDALCRRDLMDAVVAKLPSSWTMHWVEGADHSFHVLKSSGRTDADVYDEIGRVSSSWIERTRSSHR